MIREFEPHPLLTNRHAMTVAAAFWLRRFALPAAEGRLFEVEPGSRLLGKCHWQAGKRRDAPVLARWLRERGTDVRVLPTRPVLDWDAAEEGNRPEAPAVDATATEAQG